ncbi:MAG TPA: SRPBCC family protein [Sporichthya sp.]|jgi:hypothetical protein|nr:SRPBCC family protein [Sporichthya sp.]
MSGAVTHEISRSSSAPPERIFALLSDANAWSSWFKPARNVSFEPGASPPVRLVHVAPGLTIREVILEETAPNHHAYSIRSVLPVRNHRADVHLSRRPDGGTDISWTFSLQPKVPGTGALLKAGLGHAVGLLCSALVKAAES